MFSGRSNAKSTNCGDDDKVRSFEWLTSPASLEIILSSYFSLDDHNEQHDKNDGITENANTTTITNKDEEDHPQTLLQSGSHHHSIQYRQRQALHVGCGTSLIGEWLVDRFHFHHVANMDINPEALAWLEAHWNNRKKKKKQQKQQLGNSNGSSDSEVLLLPEQTFHCVDIAVDSVTEIETGSMDLVIDKSTFDCALCTGDAMTVGLLKEVYRCLHPNGGIYLVVSFHPVEFMLPLLQNCPGAQWSVTPTNIRRQVEDLQATAVAVAAEERNTSSSSNNTTEEELPSPVGSNNLLSGNVHGTWSSGSFHPDDHYNETVNVFVCQRYVDDENDKSDERGENDFESTLHLDHAAVSQHVQSSCNEWFQRHNPMLTPERLLELQRIFDNQTHPLEECYHQLLFHDQEREDLTYDFFLEDWQAFLAKRPHLPNDCMTWETARDFLQEMQ